MGASELSVPLICEVLEAEGLLSTEQRVQAETRAEAQRTALIDQIAAGEWEGHSPGQEIDAIDVIASMGLTDAKDPETTIDDVAIAKALAQHHDRQFLDLSPGSLDSETVAGTMSRPFAMRHGVIPIRVSDDLLTVAVANPLADDLLDELRRINGTEVEAVVSPKGAILKAIEETFGRVTRALPTEPARDAGAAPADEPRGRSGLLIGGVALAVGFALGLLALVVVRGGGEEQDEPLGSAASSTDEAPGDEGETEAGRGGASPGAAPHGKAAPTGPRGTSRPGPGKAADDEPFYVKVVLRRVPQGAEVWLDGERAPGSIFQVEVDGADHLLEIKARGYRPWEKTISPRMPMALDVELERVVVKAAPRPVGPSRPAGPGPAKQKGSLIRDPGF